MSINSENETQEQKLSKLEGYAHGMVGDFMEDYCGKLANFALELNLPQEILLTVSAKYLMAMSLAYTKECTRQSPYAKYIFDGVDIGTKGIEVRIPFTNQHYSILIPHIKPVEQ